MNVSTKKLTSLGLIIACSVLGLFLLSKIFTPFMAKWNEQSSAIKQKRQAIQNAHNLINNKIELSDTFAQLNQKMLSKIPQERKEGQFLTEIGKVAADTHVHIAKMNPRPIRDVGDFHELSVEVDMEANLGNLVRFLYHLRESSSVLVANSLRLQPKSERSALLKGHLVISTIFLKDK